MKDALAYILFFSYFILLVGLGELLQRAFKINPEIVRKIQHILTAPCWLILYLTTGASIHAVIICAVGTVGLAFVTFSHFFKAVAREDSNNYGVFYFGLSATIATLLCFLFFPEQYYIVGITYFSLSIADGFAPITAMLCKKFNRNIREGKSVIGCLTVLLLAFAVIVAFNYIFKAQYTYLLMVSYACLFMIAEYYGYKGLDNLFTVLIGLGYLLLELYGLNNMALAIGILVFPLILIFNMFKKSLTEGGLFAAACVVLISAYFGGLVMLVGYVSLFAANALIVGVVKHILRKKGRDIEKSKPRKAKQIIANSLISCVLSILFFFLENPIFLLAAIAVLVEEFSDSMASDIGRYQKRNPIDIIRFKRIESGLSGGVSLLGTTVALLSCFAGCTFIFMTSDNNVIKYIVLSGVAFFGVFVDSIFGSLLQNKNECVVCGKITEKDVHCDQKTVHKSGVPFISNSLVNLMTSIVIGGAALLVLYFVF